MSTTTTNSPSTKSTATPTPRPESPSPRHEPELRATKGPNGLCQSIGALLVFGAALLKPLALISALAGLGASIGLVAIAISAENWVMLGLQIGAMVAAAFAVPSAVGRYPSGPAIALFSTGGVLAACALLTEPAFVTRLLSAGSNYITVHAFSIDLMIVWFAGPQVIAGVLLCARAVFIVWTRRPARAAGYLLHAAWTGAVTLALLAIFYRASRPHALDFLYNAFGNEWVPQAIVAMLAFLGFIVLIGFVSASGHCAIRSLETGKLEDAEPARR